MSVFGWRLSAIKVVFELDIRIKVDGLGFSPNGWVMENAPFGQDTFYTNGSRINQEQKWVQTPVGEENLYQAGILFRGV